MVETNRYLIGDIRGQKGDKGETGEDGKDAGALKILATPIIGTTWTGEEAPYTQNISVSGMTEDMNPIVDIVLPDDTQQALDIMAAWEFVDKITTGNGNITVTCFKDKPEVNIPIQIKAVI